MHANTPPFDSIRFDSALLLRKLYPVSKEITGKEGEKKGGRKEIKSNRVCKRGFVLKFARGRVKIGRGEEESKSLYEKQTFWSRESGVSVVSSENPSDSTLSNVSPPFVVRFCRDNEGGDTFPLAFVPRNERRRRIFATRSLSKIENKNGE